MHFKSQLMGSLLGLLARDVETKKVETIVHLYNIYVCFDAVILSSTLSK